MKVALRIQICLATLFFGLTFCVDSAQAAILTFSDFSSTAGLTLNADAVGNLNNGIDANPVLRLVPSAGSKRGSAFSSSTVEVSQFSTIFQFRITNAGGSFDGTDRGADGFVFVIQSVGAGTVGSGGGFGMGYNGISPSVGIEWDTWNNTSWDPNSNHLGIDTNGSVVSLQTTAISPQFDDGNLWYGWIDYDGTTLEVRTNQTGVRPAAATMSRVMDITGILGTNTAYVGFTAGTGAAFGDHDIVNWEYRDEFDPIIEIPEPTTLVIWSLLATLGLSFYRRRRRR